MEQKEFEFKEYSNVQLGPPREDGTVTKIMTFRNYFGDLLLIYRGIDDGCKNKPCYDPKKVEVSLGGYDAFATPAFSFLNEIINIETGEEETLITFWNVYGRIEDWPYKGEEVRRKSYPEIVSDAFKSLFAADKLIRKMYPGYCLTKHRIEEFNDIIIERTSQ